MFGKGRLRTHLIKQLILNSLAYTDISEEEALRYVIKLSGFGAMGSPQATIVIIVEAVIKGQKKGILVGQTLKKLENTRSIKGKDSSRFQEILEIASGADPAEAMVQYCIYRNAVEESGSRRLGTDDIRAAVGTAYEDIISW